MHLDTVILVQRAHDHVLLGQRHHANIVCLGYRHRNRAGTIEHDLRHAHDCLDSAGHIDRRFFPFGLFINIDKPDRHRVLVLQRRIAEIRKGLARKVLVAAFGDDNFLGRCRRAQQKVDRAADSVGMRRSELVLVREKVGLEQDLLGNLALDVFAYQIQGPVDIRPPIPRFGQTHAGHFHNRSPLIEALIINEFSIECKTEPQPQGKPITDKRRYFAQFVMLVFYLDKQAGVRGHHQLNTGAILPRPARDGLR